VGDELAEARKRSNEGLIIEEVKSMSNEESKSSIVYQSENNCHDVEREYIEKVSSSLKSKKLDFSEKEQNLMKTEQIQLNNID